MQSSDANGANTVLNRGFTTPIDAYHPPHAKLPNK